MLKATHYPSVPMRADQITRSGIIEPYPVRTDSPVAMARQVIPEFVSSVRPQGPSIMPLPVTPDVRPGQTGLGYARRAQGQIGRASQRSFGPSLGESRRTQGKFSQKVSQATQSQSMARAGTRPVLMRRENIAHGIKSDAAPRVFDSVLPGRRMMNAYRAFLNREAAWETGNVWDMIQARQRLARIGKKYTPGPGRIYPPGLQTRR